MSIDAAAFFGLTKAQLKAHFTVASDEALSIGVSGGRTSGVLLKLIIEAYKGQLPDNVHPCFQNTGKERLETLDFIREMSARWSVPITWMEFTAKYGKVQRGDFRFKLVAYETAARKGEPFDEMLKYYAEYRRAEKDMPPALPNVAQRFCTAYLKIRLQEQFMRSIGQRAFTQAVGMRADETLRVAKLKTRNETDKWVHSITPLASVGITKSQVNAYWAANDFDLAIDSNFGNCDLCFLKAKPKLLLTIKQSPKCAHWWVKAEQRAGINFTKGRYYTDLVADAKTKTVQELELAVKALDPAESIDCSCTD